MGASALRIRKNGGPKHQQVFDALKKQILAGKYKAGQKFPSEAALVKQFGTSRITVGRAVRDLQQQGLVQRRAGSGTYVRKIAAGENALLFGLLIPDLGETEIFEPICEGMAAARQSGEFALLWGSANSTGVSKEEQAWRLCEQYIARRLNGVFFAPLELVPEKDEVNHRIVAAFDREQIPVTLLDRGILAYPERSKYDLVGIDNRRAGYLATEHLLKLGSRRVVFVARPNAAPTVDARIAGYREAMQAHERVVKREDVQRVDAADKDEVRRMLATLRADAFVCANDRTAGYLMHSLLALGRRIPADVRIVGMDDVEYASLLPVPLTTIHQPCREIGEAAISAMLERVARPGMLARDVLVDCRLVVRESCGKFSRN